MSNIKNVDAYSRLVGLCTGFGGTYNPGQQNLKLNAMRALLDQAQSSLQDVKSKTNVYKHVTNEREIAFADVVRLASMITFTVKASDAPVQTLKDAQYFLRLISGRIKNRAPIPAAEAEEQPGPRRSFSQRSYVAVAHNLGKLVDLVSTIPQYKPNEDSLQIEALLAKVEKLLSLNEAVTTARIARSNAIIKSNRLLYHGTDSMVRNAYLVRSYVRVVYGPGSEQLKQLSRLVFTKPRVR